MSMPEGYEQEGDWTERIYSTATLAERLKPRFWSTLIADKIMPRK
jgi:hypothetical protein